MGVRLEARLKYWDTKTRYRGPFEDPARYARGGSLSIVSLIAQNVFPLVYYSLVLKYLSLLIFLSYFSSFFLFKKVMQVS